MSLFYPTITSDEAGDIEVSIVAYSGDIDIFISNGYCKHANESNYNYTFQVTEWTDYGSM